MGRMAVSLQLYAKLLGSTDGGLVSIRTQQKFISNVLEICNDHRKKALAGVDRMAAPPSLSSAGLRDRARKAHLDRIVQVIQYNKTASRVLELPNMDLPLIHDATVAVIAEEESTLSHMQQQNRRGSYARLHLGEAKVGSPDAWDDLMLWTIAGAESLSEGCRQQFCVKQYRRRALADRQDGIAED
jgi:hypothetical protein